MPKEAAMITVLALADTCAAAQQAAVPWTSGRSSEHRRMAGASRSHPSGARRPGGIHRVSLARLEAGTAEAKASTLHALAVALGVSVEALYAPPAAAPRWEIADP